VERPAPKVDAKIPVAQAARVEAVAVLRRVVAEPQAKTAVRAERVGTRAAKAARLDPAAQRRAVVRQAVGREQAQPLAAQRAAPAHPGPPERAASVA
jgi:hypothetical protein